MLVKKDVKKATKAKRSSRKKVDKKVVNDLINEIERKVLGLRYGYMANEEIRKLRELFK